MRRLPDSLLVKRADECKTRGELEKRHPSIYGVAQKRKMLDELFKNHPNKGYTKNQVIDGFWQNKEHCLAAAKKHNTRTEFRTEFMGAYASCRKNGWLEEACEHMEVPGNYAKRYVYALKLKKEVYVGLTCRPNRRLKDHREDGTDAVKSLLNRGGKMVLLTKLIPVKQCKELESRYIGQYKKNGLKVLNKIKAGGTGGNAVIWNPLNLQASADAVDTSDDLKKLNPGAYQAAIKMGVLRKLFKNHPNEGRKQLPPGTHTPSFLQMIANSVDGRKELHDMFPSVHAAATKKGLMNKLFKDHPNQGRMIAKMGFYTIKELSSKANLCETRIEFFNRFRKHYDAAVEYGRMDLLFKNHPNKGFVRRPRRKLNEKDLQKLVKQYKNRAEFRKQDSSAYSTALQLGIVDKIFSKHKNAGMKVKPSGYWTIERSLAEARQYSTRMEFKNSAFQAYDVVKDAGMLAVVFGEKRASRGATKR